MASMALVAALVLFSFFQLTVGLNPMILVPGDGGSRLEIQVNEERDDFFYCAKHITNYTLVWVNVEYLVPLTVNCLQERLTLRYNRASGTTSNRPGVKISTPGWGATWASEYLGNLHLEKLKYFADIVDSMVTHEGYVRGVTIRGAPYDFRKGYAELEDFRINLMRLVEETYAMASNQPVILLGHSYGCLQVLRLLQEAPPAWKAKFVRSYVSLHGPYFGSVVSLRMFVSGYNLNIPTIKPRWLRDAQRSWPSSYLLMPDPGQWQSHDILVASPKKNYTVANLKELFTDLHEPDAWSMYQTTHAGTDPYTPPGVETFCIFGDNVETDAWLDYRQDPGWPYEAGQPRIVKGDGDGTVPLRSLNACEQWRGRQRQKVHKIVLHGANHFSVLRDPRLTDVLRNQVVDQGTPV